MKKVTKKAKAKPKARAKARPKAKPKAKVAAKPKAAARAPAAKKLSLDKLQRLQGGPWKTNARHGRFVTDPSGKVIFVKTINPKLG
jgi:hypothetical protein